MGAPRPKGGNVILAAAGVSKLDRLIHESGTHAEYSGSEREALERAANVEPTCRTGLVRGKDRHAGR